MQSTTFDNISQQARHYCISCRRPGQPQVLAFVQGFSELLAGLPFHLQLAKGIGLSLGDEAFVCVVIPDPEPDYLICDQDSQCSMRPCDPH